MIQHEWFMKVDCESFGVVFEKTTQLPALIPQGYVISFDGENDFVVLETSFDIDDQCCLPTLKYCGDGEFTAQSLRGFIKHRINSGWNVMQGSLPEDDSTLEEWCKRHELDPADFTS